MKTVFGIMILFLCIGLLAPTLKYHAWTRFVLIAVIAVMVLYITVA